MLFRQIFDEKLAQYSYLVGCQKTKEALVIDPQRDIDRYIDLAEHEGMNIVATTETHIHADFLSGSRELAERLGCKVYLSDEGDEDWKYEWPRLGNYDVQLLYDGDTFMVGNIEIKAVHTPGHTPEHLAFLVTDRGGGADEPMGLASGDFVFVGDVGRPDLLESAAGISGMMEPSARTLYGSLVKFLKLEDYLQIWPGHGAGSACGKELGAVPGTTIGYEKRFNAALDAVRSGEDAFVDTILAGQPEPPLYWARMKRDNKIGADIIGHLPRPRKLTAAELKTVAMHTDVALVDTRLERTAYMAEHIPGSIYAPLNRAFNTVVGSYVPENTPIYLIVDEEKVEEAVRDLVRIGLDNIVGYATTEVLEHYFEEQGKKATIQEITFDDIDSFRQSPDVQVLDVRGLAEWQPSRVAGSMNVAHTRMLVRMNELPRDKTLAVYCGGGGRAASASSLLAKNGFDVTFVNGEFELYAEKGTVEEGLPEGATA